MVILPSIGVYRKIFIHQLFPVKEIGKEMRLSMAPKAPNALKAPWSDICECIFYRKIFIHQLFPVKEKRKGNTFVYGAKGALFGHLWMYFLQENNYPSIIFCKRKTERKCVCLWRQRRSQRRLGSDICECIFYRKIIIHQLFPVKEKRKGNTWRLWRLGSDIVECIFYRK